VLIVNDHLIEPNETLVVDLANPANAVLSQGRHTYTISDNDVAPVVLITSPGSGTVLTNTPQLLYTITPADATATVFVDGNVVNKTSGSFLDPLGNVVHQVRVNASDGFNTGTAVVTFTVNYDPPVVTIRSPSSSVYSSATTTLMYQVDRPSSVLVTIDNVAVNKVSGDQLSLAEGEHTLRIDATDAGGVTGHTEVSFVVSTGAQPAYAALWSKAPLAQGNNATAADGWGNVYVAGSSAGYNASVVKYDMKGTQLWNQAFPSTEQKPLNVTGMAIDSEGGVYVSLWTQGGIQFPEQGEWRGHVGPPNTRNAFLVKYDKNGLFQWVSRIGGIDGQQGIEVDNYPCNIAIDKHDNVYVGGLIALVDYLQPSGYSAFWAKFDKTTGVWLTGEYFFAVTVAGVSPNAVTEFKVALDQDGNPGLTGYTNTSIFNDPTIYPNAGGSDYFLAKYNHFDASGYSYYYVDWQSNQAPPLMTGPAELPLIHWGPCMWPGKRRALWMVM
jgi:hypothetical protein